MRAIKHSPISWIYLHGMELEKRDKRGQFSDRSSKYWLCKDCYDKGKVQLMSPSSTTSCAEHLKNSHFIYEPGVGLNDASAATIADYLEAQHPSYSSRALVY